MPIITTLARAGALEQAWQLFETSGYGTRSDDPAALAVRGRLLKDTGLRLSGTERRKTLAEAAGCYARADAVQPQTYLAINAATLRLLSGNAVGATSDAHDVISRMAVPDGSETPYWLAATEAEALLILGKRDAAAAAFTKAKQASPDAWDDHATTLRQLGLILDAQEVARSWLDPHRPPRCIHYAGHLGVATEAMRLGSQISDWLKRENIGFAYGALAAGADIQIAEAVSANGAELHVILPVQTEAFLAQSVRPYGQAWVTRFQSCIGAAASVREVTGVKGGYEPLATSIASDMAMGAAALQARRLETEALQLLIADEGAGETGDGVATARDSRVWAGHGRRQHLIRWPRDGGVDSAKDKIEGRPDYALNAMVSIGVSGLDDLDEGAFAEALDTWLSSWWSALDALSEKAARRQPIGNALVFAFAVPNDALGFIRAVVQHRQKAQLPITIVAHYALLHQSADRLVGSGLPVIEAMNRIALPGTVLLSDALATVAAIARDGPIMEPMGELQGEPLYTLINI